MKDLTTVVFNRLRLKSLITLHSDRDTEKRWHYDTMMLSIGDLATQTRESVKTLRYWTDQQLLETRRGNNNYRYYSPDTPKRVAFIRRTQALGFSLEEIKSILELRSEGVQPCNEVRHELSQHLAAVQARIAELGRLETELVARLAWAKAHPDPDCAAEGCVYLEPRTT